MRFGDPRVQALAGALAVTAHLIGGFTNKIPPTVGRRRYSAQHYSQARCCYDLRRLKTERPDRATRTFQHLRPHRRRATLRRLLHQDHNRLLRPLMAADQPPAPLEVRQALRVLDQAVTEYIDNARIAA